MAAIGEYDCAVVRTSGPPDQKLNVIDLKVHARTYQKAADAAAFKSEDGVTHVTGVSVTNTKSGFTKAFQTSGIGSRLHDISTSIGAGKSIVRGYTKTETKVRMEIIHRFHIPKDGELVEFVLEEEYVTPYRRKEKFNGRHLRTEQFSRLIYKFSPDDEVGIGRGPLKRFTTDPLPYHVVVGWTQHSGTGECNRHIDYINGTLVGRWSVVPVTQDYMKWNKNENYEYRFENEQAALQFKLRWG